MLIQMAYDIQSEQIAGGAAWAGSDLFTVIARAPQGGPVLPEPTQQDLTRERLQTLLSECFHLVLKQQANPASGYVLSVDKKGHKMSVANDAGPVMLRQTGRWAIHAERVRMSALAGFLGVHLRTTVEDRAGLDGGFNFNLNWTPWDSSVYPPRDLPEDSLIPAVR